MTHAIVTDGVFYYDALYHHLIFTLGESAHFAPRNTYETEVKP